jgi:hypothetical protein
MTGPSARQESFKITVGHDRSHDDQSGLPVSGHSQYRRIAGTNAFRGMST